MHLEQGLKSVLPLSMISYFFGSCWVFLIPLIQRQLGFPYIEIGLIIGISTLASLIARLLFGHLADRFGPTLIFRMSSIGLCLSNVIVFFSYDTLLFTVACTFYLFSCSMIYWTSMLVINSNRKRISLWLSFNNLAGFVGFVMATIISTLFGPRTIFGALFFLPILGIFSKNVEIKKSKMNGAGLDRRLLALSLAGFFMVFQVAIWSSFLPIYLNDVLPTFYAFLSTGIFLACDSLFFTFIFYFSGKVHTKTRGAALVSVATLIFTSIVSAIPLLPLAPFLLTFIIIRNIIIAFRMIGVAEMVGQEEMGNFQTQFYSTFSSSASIIAPSLGGLIADSAGLDYVFFFSVPFGLLSAILFFSMRQPHQKTAS